MVEEATATWLFSPQHLGFCGECTIATGSILTTCDCQNRCLHKLSNGPLVDDFYDKTEQTDKMVVSNLTGGAVVGNLCKKQPGHAGLCFGRVDEED